MDDRTSNSTGNNTGNNTGPNNVGVGPGTGDPRPGFPGGGPADVRDGVLRQRPPVDDRAGPANPGLAAEGVSPNPTHSTVTPSVTRSGWASGGMAIPGLVIVVAVLALIALVL